MIGRREAMYSLHGQGFRQPAIGSIYSEWRPENVIGPIARPKSDLGARPPDGYWPVKACSPV